MAVFRWSREWEYEVGLARDGAGRLVENGNRQCAVATVAGQQLLGQAFVINNHHQHNTILVTSNIIAYISLIAQNEPFMENEVMP